MMLVHASFIFMNAAAGGRRSCLSGVNTCPDRTYYAAVVPLFRAVLLSLRHEICFHVDRFCVAGAGSCRHISAPAAHHALSSACAAMFFRSSPRAYRWLLGHRYLGPYIRSFREDRSIPLRAKIVALSLLWLTSLHCVVLIFDSWWLRAAMLAVALGVSCYILSFKTRRNAD